MLSNDSSKENHENSYVENWNCADSDATVFSQLQFKFQRCTKQTDEADLTEQTLSSELSSVLLL